MQDEGETRLSGASGCVTGCVALVVLGGLFVLVVGGGMAIWAGVFESVRAFGADGRRTRASARHARGWLLNHAAVRWVPSASGTRTV